MSDTVFQKKGKICPFSAEGAPALDYKNPDFLGKFVSERGKIMPRRLTNATAKKQRELANAIKKARIIALMPFVDND